MLFCVARALISAIVPWGMGTGRGREGGGAEGGWWVDWIALRLTGEARRPLTPHYAPMEEGAVANWGYPGPT